jgi:hypothetical protein
VSRLLLAAGVIPLLLAGCGSDTKTVTETTTQSSTATTSSVAQTTVTTAVTTPEGTTTAPVAVAASAASGNHGPHYFMTPSDNIGCYLSAKSVRCDIRERNWSPPPKPRYCIKFGVDWGQGIGVGSRKATFVCAGDTVLGGPGELGYGQTAQRGSIVCDSETKGMTCSNGATGHGFFLSRETYRIF